MHQGGVRSDGDRSCAWAPEHTRYEGETTWSACDASGGRGPDGGPAEHLTIAFDRLRLRDLRHEGATLALAADVHPKIVSEGRGHSSIAITLDLYSHVLPGMQSKAAEQVSAIIFGGRV